MIRISPIPAELTYDIRHLVLRQGLPRESCYWDTDKGAGVFHLGAWIGERMAGVATFQPEAYPEQPERSAYRLRGMAVLPEFRSLGVGGLMLLAGEDKVREAGMDFAWCYARIGALDFYQKYGWRKVGKLFDIPTAGLHKFMYKELGQSGCCGR